VLLLAYWIYSEYKKRHQQKQNGSNPQKPFEFKKIHIIIGILCIAAIVGYVVWNNNKEEPLVNKNIPLSEAVRLSQLDVFDEMTLNTSKYGFSYIELIVSDNISEDINTKDADGEEIVLKSGDTINSDVGVLSLTGLVNSGLKLPPTYNQEQYSEPYDWTSLISPLLLIALLGGVYFWAYGGMGGGKGQLFKREKNDVKFSDIGGLSEIKESLKEVVGFINNRNVYETIGARIPRGIILEGAPGVGKTMLAKAIANEANVPFYYSSGSEFHTMWVGMAGQRIKSLFKKAGKSNSVIFIDEIDSIAHRRSDGGTDASREWNHTLNQLLAEMDGFKSNRKVMVIAATNRYDVLDPAVLRAGRFDYKINVPMPSYNDRCEIINIYLKDKKINEDVNISSVAKQTANFSGADLDLLVNEAAMLAGKEQSWTINMAHFVKAIDKVLVGEERKSVNRTEVERKLIAYHEAGHAVIANRMPDGEKVERISILQHTKSGGFTRMSQEVETTILPKSKILRGITIMLGGRSGEELLTQDITSGASDDLKKANELAREMVERYGMSEKFGLRYNLKNDMGLGVISNDTAKLIDEDVNGILADCHKKATELINDNKDVLEKVANKLLEVETLSGEELSALMEAK
jgi:cell division protease FtsH